MTMEVISQSVREILGEFPRKLTVTKQLSMQINWNLEKKLYFMHHKTSISFVLNAVFTAFFIYLFWGIFARFIIDSRKQTGSYGEEERGNGMRRCRLDSNLNLSQAPRLIFWFFKTDNPYFGVLFVPLVCATSIIDNAKNGACWEDQCYYFSKLQFSPKSHLVFDKRDKKSCKHTHWSRNSSHI